MYQKKYLKYKYKYNDLKQKAGLGQGLYYDRLKSPYDYGGDFAVAKLYVDAKDALMYPTTKINLPNDFFKYDNLKNTDFYNQLKTNKYIAYYDSFKNVVFNGNQYDVSPGEKLLIAIVCKIYIMCEKPENWIDFVWRRKYMQTIIPDTENYIMKLLSNNLVNINKFNDIMRIIVSVISEYNTQTFLEKGFKDKLYNMYSINTIIDIYDYILRDRNFILNESLVANMPKNLGSEILVNIFTRTGAFGINTFLLLLFNELIPIGTGVQGQCEEEEICVHAETRSEAFDVMMHDMDHASRTLRVLLNKRWYGYLKTCYMMIINNIINDKSLLFYLFYITNETGGYFPKNMTDFESKTNSFFKITRGFKDWYMVEGDAKVIKMMENIHCADKNLTYIDKDRVNNEEEIKQNQRYIMNCIMNLHHKFDNEFNIIRASTPIDGSIDEPLRMEIINLLERVPDDKKAEFDKEVRHFTNIIL